MEEQDITKRNALGKLCHCAQGYIMEQYNIGCPFGAFYCNPFRDIIGLTEEERNEVQKNITDCDSSEVFMRFCIYNGITLLCSHQCEWREKMDSCLYNTMVLQH